MDTIPSAITSHLGEKGRKRRTEGSPLGVCMGVGRSHLSSHSQLDFIGVNPIKCPLRVSGNSGQAVVSTRYVSLDNPYSVLGNTRWTVEQRRVFVVDTRYQCLRTLRITTSPPRSLIHSHGVTCHPSSHGSVPRQCSDGFNSSY